MSKYTTELRYICEYKAGLTSSVSLSQIDSVIEQSWDKIFTTKVPFFDENYRPPLCKKIIKNYWFREIGLETAALFLFHLNTTLERIMPYYNQLYRSELLEFNPFYDVDYEKTGLNSNTGKEETNDNGYSFNTRTDNLQAHQENDLHTLQTNDLRNETSSENLNLFHDTPQGSISQLDDSSYLTDARKITDKGSDTNTGTVDTANTGSVTNLNTGNQDNDTATELTGKKEFGNTNEYIESVKGKQSGTSYAKMLMEFRESMLNIDNLVIEEFSDCFMGLY